mgnify:FL=1
MQKSGVTAEFVYNADGLRVQKTVNGVATKYTLHGKNVVHMTSGTDELHFFYDAQNRPAVVVYNGTAYAYVKSLQGDIVAILDENGNAIVSYGYDAWGAPIGKSGTFAETLGTLNPFRYRGYVYDEETGLYYLRNRYYLPSFCRMLNSDLLFESNLYTYCKNSPIRRVDASGCKDYATIGPGEDLFDLVHNQEFILGYVSDYLAEQQRIINANIRYNWKGQSDKAGYSCATFISKPLQKISQNKTNKGKFIRSYTGIGSMLKNSGNHLLFIARLSDYSLDEIPVGASFLRTAGYNGAEHGHGATFAARLSNGMLTINHAAGTEEGILSEDITYEELCRRFEYIAWPAGLGTLEENPTLWRVRDEPDDFYE